MDHLGYGHMAVSPYLYNVWQTLRRCQRAVHNGQRLQRVAISIHRRLQQYKLVQDAQSHLGNLHTVDAACNTHSPKNKFPSLQSIPASVQWIMGKGCKGLLSAF